MTDFVGNRKISVDIFAEMLHIVSPQRCVIYKSCGCRTFVVRLLRTTYGSQPSQARSQEHRTMSVRLSYDSRKTNASIVRQIFRSMSQKFRAIVLRLPCDCRATAVRRSCDLDISYVDRKENGHVEKPCDGLATSLRSRKIARRSHDVRESVVRTLAIWKKIRRTAAVRLM